MSEYNEDDAQVQENEQEQEAPEETPQDNIVEGEDDEVDYRALYEKEKEQRQGLVKKVSVLKKKSQSSPQADNERLDKIELRQLNPNLTAEQANSILKLKKANGGSVEEAYNDPMVQAFISAENAKKEKTEKVANATPKTQSGSSVDANAGKFNISHSKDWLKQLPGDNTMEVAKALEDAFLKG